MQQPIAPPYASFFKHKFAAHVLEETDFDKAVTDATEAILANVESADVASTSSAQAEASRIDLDELIEKLKISGDIPDIPEDYKLPEKGGLFGSLDYQDYVKMIAKERAEISDNKFCPAFSLLCDTEPKGINVENVTSEEEDYKNYVKVLLEQSKHEGEDQTLAENEPEYMKVIKEALFNDRRLDKNEFLQQLDDAVKKDNRKEFFFECTCDEDSDLE